MANYIGNSLQSGEFKKLDSITSLFNGTLTEFSLQFNGADVQAGDATQLMVSINGVVQEPLTSYTLGTGGSKIVFLSAPPAGASCFMTYFGGIGGTTTPSDNSVTLGKLIPSIQSTLESVADKADSVTVNAAIALKADQSTTDTALALKADKINVLQLNNTSAYSPSAAYHPATKGYVDAMASSGGGNVSITKGYTFAGNGSTVTFDCGAASSYILGAIDIYHNGIQLDSTDYTAADGRNFTLTSLTPASGDIIKLVAYGGADVYTKTQTNTLLDGKASLGGATFTGQTNITAAGQLSTLTSTNAFASGYNDVVQILAPNQTGGGLSFNIGKSASTRNLGKMAFIYDGNNSILNKLSFGFFDADGLLTLDAAGRVLKPSQPAFRVKFVSSGQSGGAGFWVFDSVENNVGGWYNPSNGRFTAPVSGRYMIMATAQHWGGTSNGGYVDVYKNGNLIRGMRMEWANTTSYETRGVSGVFEAAANDYFQVYNACGTNAHLDHCSFSGYLIG